MLHFFRVKYLFLVFGLSFASFGTTFSSATSKGVAVVEPTETQPEGKFAKLKTAIKKHKGRTVAAVVSGVAALALSYFTLRVAGGKVACPYASVRKGLGGCVFGNQNSGSMEFRSTESIGTQSAHREWINLGEELGGFLSTRAPMDHDKPLILYCGGNQEGVYGYAKKIADRTGCPVVAFDYPGVCNSGGFPWSAKHCAGKIAAELKTVRSKPELKDRRLVVVGNYFGCDIGALIAEQEKCPMLMQNPLSSASDYAAKRCHLPRFVAKPLTSMCGFNVDLPKKIKTLTKDNLVVVLNATNEDSYLIDKNGGDIRLGHKTGVAKDPNLIVVNCARQPNSKTTDPHILSPMPPNELASEAAKSFSTKIAAVTEPQGELAAIKAFVESCKK